MAVPLWAMASDEVDPSATAELGAVCLVADDAVAVPDGEEDPDSLTGTEGGSTAPGVSGDESSERPSAPVVKTMTAKFYVSIYKGDELPENYGSVNCNVSNYTSAIEIDDALHADQHGLTYRPSGLGSDVLLRIPSISQVKAACDAKGIPFDPSTQRVIWYVVKHEGDGWHVDGAILDPDYGEEPEPVDPVDPVEPEPVEPQPVDPVKPSPADPVKPAPSPIVPPATDEPASAGDPADEPVDEPAVEPEPEEPAIDPEPVAPIEPDTTEIVKSFVTAVGVCGGIGMGLASVGLVFCLSANIASLRRLRKLAEMVVNARRIR